jgi:ABC-2 type transport system permease protein
MDLLTFLGALPVMMLITFGLVSIGLTIASFMDSLESFGVIQSFINLPLFFLSGALFPIQGESVPSWLQIASNLNPLTYGVDTLRTIILRDAWQPLHPLYYNLLVICCFDAGMIVIGMIAFSRRK